MNIFTLILIFPVRILVLYLCPVEKLAVLLFGIRNNPILETLVHSVIQMRNPLAVRTTSGHDVWAESSKWIKSDRNIISEGKA